MARILIVDDDPDILKMAEKILTMAGHRAISALDAKTGIELLETGHFDLLLSDANMPNMSGFDFIQRIRNNPQFGHLAIAMLTGLRERKDVELAVKSGVDDYIVKPLDPLLLVQKLNVLLDRKQPTIKPEIKFTKEPHLSKATLNLSVQLESISELGAVIVTSLAVSQGDVLDLQTPFFDNLGEKAPPMKVLAIEKLENSHHYRIELVFLGATEPFLQKVRRYIFQHAANHRAVS